MGTKVSALAAVLVLAVSACGGSDDASGSSDTNGASAPSKVEVAAHLLTVADLPTPDALDAPWEVRDVTEGVEIQIPACLDEDRLAGDHTAQAKLAKVTDFHLPSLEQQITGYPDDAGARTAYDAAAARLDGCANPEFVYQETPSAGAITPLDLGVDLGPRAKAWRTTVTIAGAQIAVTTIHVAKGNLEMSIVYTDIGNPDTATIAGYASTATGKM
jgi:hypothetical protein